MSKQRKQVLAGQPIEGHPRKCPQCGKQFYPTSQWAYRNRTKTWCSWKCLREDEAGIPPHPGEAAPPRVMPDEVVTRVKEANERAAKQAMRPVITPAADARVRHEEEEQKRLCREYFRLFETEGLTQAQAAERFGVSHATLKLWLKRWREDLGIRRIRSGPPPVTPKTEPQPETSENRSGEKTKRINAAIFRMHSILADLNEEVRRYAG